MNIGPNTDREGLVIHLDADNVRSIDGEPTTNLFGDLATMNAFRPNSTEFNDDNLDIPSPPERVGKIFKHTSGALTSTWSGNSYGYSYKDITVPYDTTYVSSCWVYLTEDCNLTRFHVSQEKETAVNTSNFSYDFTKKGTWQKVWQSGYVPSSTPDTLRCLIYPGIDGVEDGSFTGAYYYGGFQVERKDYPTKFTEGSRDLWRDLSGNENHFTTTNSPQLIEDEEGRKCFDFYGAEKHFESVNNSPFSGSNFPITVQAVFRENTTTSFAGILTQGQQNSTKCMSFMSYNGKFATDQWGPQGRRLSLSPELNKIHFVTWVTPDWTNHKTNTEIYLGDISQPTDLYADGSTTTDVVLGKLKIGNWQLDRTDMDFNGQLYSIKVYDRALSKEEISQNFKAFKNKYKLAPKLEKRTDSYGTWVKLFRHNSSTGEFFSNTRDWAEARETNIDNPNANKYSILYKWGDYLRNGKYTLKLNYPNDNNLTNIWSQTNNPTVPGEYLVTDYTAINIESSSNGWGGLENYTSQSSTYLDGTVNHGNWFYAVGAMNSYGNSTSFPSHNGSTSLVELWILDKPA